MALSPRELLITYGSTSVGYGTAYLIDGPFRFDRNYPFESAGTVTVTFSLLVVGATETAFQSACSTIETAFHKPRQALSVAFIDGGGTTWTHETFAPTSNTGFDAEPTIRKPGSPHDTGRSRLYEISITCKVPADLTGQNGRINSSVTLSASDAGRRRLQITGAYTALGSNSARTQYEASIATYVATLTSGFGGTWEGPFDEQAAANDTDKTLNFSRVYEELIFNQSSGTLDDATLTRSRFKIQREASAPGDTFSVAEGSAPLRLETFTVSYETGVAKSVTQDLKGTYETKIKPFLVQTVMDLASASSVALISQTPDFDETENRIAVSMTLKAATGGTLLSASARTDDMVDLGKDFVAVWDKDSLAKYVFQGAADMTRTVTYTSTELDTGLLRKTPGRSFDLAATIARTTGSYNSAPVKSINGGALRAELVDTHVSYTPLTIGRDNYTIDVIQQTYVARWRYVVNPSGDPTGPEKTATGIGGAGGAPVTGGGSTVSGGGSTVTSHPSGTGSGGGTTGGGGSAGPTIIGDGLVPQSTNLPLPFGN